MGNKIFLLSIIAAFGISANVFALEGGIQFMPKETPFEEVLKKAKEEDKLILLTPSQPGAVRVYG